LFHELAPVIRGTATHVTTAGSETIAVDDLIVLRPQVWHAFEGPSTDFAVIHCLISPALLRQLLPLVAMAGPLFDLFWRRTSAAARPHPPVIRLDALARAEVFHCRTALEREQRGTDTESQAVATGIGMTLLARVGREWGKAHVPTRPRLSPRAEAAARQVSAHLEAHLDRPPSLAKLAQQVRMTPPHLSRCFATRMGSGIVAFVHRLRTEEACLLLRLTDLSVTRIAQRPGYDEVAYFSRRFRACTGRSPREYRSAAG
jgi:AraC-like DNA-binding protein